MLKLILIDAPSGEQHTTFRVDDDATEVIGRQAPRLRTSDTRVSREHAEVRVQNGVWVIRDLGSANGTLVNGRPISGLCELEEDDIIQLGRVKMIVAVARIEPTTAPALAPADADAGPDDTAAEDVPLSAPVSDGDTGFDEVLDPVVGQVEPPPARPETPDELPADPPSLDEVTLADAPPAPTPSRPSEASRRAEVSESAEILENPELSDSAEGLEKAEGSESAEDAETAETSENNEGSERPERSEAAEAPAHADDDIAAAGADVDDEAAHGQAVVDDVPPAEETAKPVAPEPASGLRLANYDVLGDDELAEALAADTPPAVPVADTPVQIELPEDADDADVAHADEALLLDVDAQADADFDADLDAGAQTPERPAVADDHGPPAEAPAAEEPHARPRPAPASADSHLITPAPDSALGGYHQDHGFPWRGTAAAVLTLAAVGVGGWLLSQGALSGPLTPVTGPSTAPANPPDAPTALAPAAPVTARPTIPRGQPSPFDAGPLLTAPITPRSRPIPARPPAAQTPPPTPTPTPTPRVEPQVEPEAQVQKPTQARPQPDPRPATPAPAPEPAPTLAPAPAVAITPPPAVVPEAPAPATAPATPGPIAGDTPAAAVPAPAPAEPTAPAPAAEPAVALVPPALTDPTPQPTTALLPDVVRDAVPATPPGTDADAPSVASPPIAAPPVSAPLAAARRVVYVVDASGSMVDSMNQGVLTWLETQVGGLRPDDAFTVVFFRDDEVLETPPAGLKPGLRDQQVKALDWMAPESGNMRPRGRSRPLAALRLAASYQANEIVLLTDDNFGLRSGEDISPDALARTLRPSDPDAATPTVHAVQFFYEDPTGRLKDIAKLFGGRYEFVEEPPFDAGPTLDDLLGG